MMASLNSSNFFHFFWKQCTEKSSCQVPTERLSEGEEYGTSTRAIGFNLKTAMKKTKRTTSNSVKHALYSLFIYTAIGVSDAMTIGKLIQETEICI